MTGTVRMKSDASCQIKRRPSERQTDDFERRRYEPTFGSSNYGFSRSSLSEKWVEWSKRSNSTGRVGLCKELMSIRRKKMEQSKCSPFMVTASSCSNTHALQRTAISVTHTVIRDEEQPCRDYPLMDCLNAVIIIIL